MVTANGSSFGFTGSAAKMAALSVFFKLRLLYL